MRLFNKILCFWIICISGFPIFAENSLFLPEKCYKCVYKLLTPKYLKVHRLFLYLFKIAVRILIILHSL